MRIRLFTQLCGPGGNLAPGEQDVSPELGEQLVKAGAAVALEEVVVETATVAPVENTAATPKPRRKKKGR